MTSFRFVHTGDWQIGMMARRLGSAASRVRAARIEAIRNVLDAADAHDADAILVAGDLFEDTQVDASLVEQVAGMLNDSTRVPIYLIPGNHDPDTREGIYRRPIWGQLREHVHVLRDAEPIRLAENVTLYPCPLKHKAGYEDPTACIPPREDSAEIRIGLAHGTLPIQHEIGEDAFPIALDRAEQAGLDYLALGHWHSTLQYPPGGSGRTWYSGTHETTSFGERDSGNVLQVTLAGPGAPPRVEPVRTGTLAWLDHDIDLDRQTMDEAMRGLRELTDPERTLLRVTLHGQVSGEGEATLEDLLALLAQRFLHHQVDDSGLRPPSLHEGGVADLLGSPYLRQTAAYLETIAGGESNEGADPAVALRALQILHQAAWRQHSIAKGETAT